MSSPVPPTISNFTVGVIVATVICLFVIVSRNRSYSTYQFSNNAINQSLDQQIIALDPKFNRHNRLAEISPIDINTAPFETVMLLPRISENVARGIVSGRPFHTIEQLDDVFGIGPKTVELFRPHVIVDQVSLQREYPKQFNEHRLLNRESSGDTFNTD